MPDSDGLSIPLLDAIDVEILMHRDAHFSSHFDIMLEYYENDGVGVMPDFSIKKIKKLLSYEKNHQEDLSELLLPDSSKEEVKDAKAMYLSLRAVYENKDPAPIAVAISDLILTEEENPEEEMSSVISFGSSIVSSLIDLIKTDKLYNPLYPGYGRAPIFAAHCLGMIQDEKAIPPLFQMLGQENFFTDEAFILALISFGDKVHDFLLKRLKHEPLSKDNEHAAIVLTSMPENERVGKECLELLHHPHIKDHVTLANYLLLGCSGLKTPEDRQSFLSVKDKIPGIMKHEADLIAKCWSKNSKK